MTNSNLSNRCRVFGPCIFYALRKIKAKCPEVILVLASNQRKPYEVLIIQGKPPSPNLEKVGKRRAYRKDSACHIHAKRKKKGIEEEIIMSCPRKQKKEGHIGRILLAMPKQAEKEGYIRRILPVIPKEPEKEGHRGRILPVMPKQAEKEET